MCGPMALPLLAGLATAGGQLYGGLAANAQGKYEARVAQENRRHELAAAADARERGTIDQMRHYRKLAYNMGEMRSKQAASGLDLTFGSVADLETDTALLGYEDSGIIAENTRREVQGYEINAANYTMQARGARSRGKSALIGSGFQAASTILSSASSVNKASKG